MASSDIEQFIYQICYQPMWNTVAEYIYIHPTLLDLTYSRIVYPDFAVLRDMLLEYVTNIEIDEDILRFDAAVSCTIELQSDDEYSGYGNCDIPQWLMISCVATVTDHLDSFEVSSIKRYRHEKKPINGGVAASKNIVPIIRKEDLDTEATKFLERYCKEALEKPMRVPIEEIAQSLGLTIQNGKRITEDFSVIGEICFSKGSLKVWDLFKDEDETLNVERGTILIDACTYLEQNLGRVNNTIAHEVFHWQRHRLYAAIKQILHHQKIISCRCPTDMIYPKKNEPWTDEQRMEWQANNIAPRILMPKNTFCMKVDELYERYNYKESPIKLAVLTCIADELAKFYGVSRQSAIIRMIETGYKEAAGLQHFQKESDLHSYVSEADAFYEYSNNQDFQNLVDSGSFRYIDGYFVLNANDYVEISENGHYSLTDYAWEHLDDCTLKFSWQALRKDSSQKNLSYEILHRVNAERKVSKYQADKNSNVLKLSEEIQRKREEFEQLQADKKVIEPQRTCWELIFNIVSARGLSKQHFCNLTGLGEEVYRKAQKNIDTKPDVRTIVSVAHGLKLDIDTTNKLMQLAGHAFDDSDESQAYRFCITGLSDYSFEDCNKFLESYNYKPLGTIQKS